jgi:hypothetical protein
MKKFLPLLVLIGLLFSCATSNPTSDDTQTFTIIGSWTRQSSTTRSYTEVLQFHPDGSYEVEAADDDDSSQIAQGSGNYTFDGNTIYYNSGTTETYYLHDDGNKLVVNDVTENPWSRL